MDRDNSFCRALNMNFDIHLIRIVLASLFCLLSQGVGAVPLTLAHALHLAEDHSPNLKVANSRALGAEAALDSASAFPNPDIEFGAGNSQLLPPAPESGRNSMLALSQPLELPTVRSARRRAAEAGIVSGSALLADAKLNLYAQVKRAFFEVLRSREEVQLAKDNHELLLLIRSRVKLRVDVGESPRYELVKSEAETLTAESAARSAAIRSGLAMSRLSSLLGVPLDDHAELANDSLMVADLPGLDQLSEELQSSQPLLKYSFAETQRAEALLDYERALRLPQTALRWSTERHPDVNLWRVGIVLTVPLWNQHSGPVAEARANLDSAQAVQERIRYDLLNELGLAYSRYQIARRQMEIFETGLMRDAETTLKVAEAAYRYGERGILDYLDAQRVFRSTNSDYLNARYELQFSLIEIERLRSTYLYESKK